MQRVTPKHEFPCLPLAQGVFTVPGDGIIRFARHSGIPWPTTQLQGWLVVEAEQESVNCKPL